jgi:cytoskeletal protein CcmA (bactofilin family)
MRRRIFLLLSIVVLLIAAFPVYAAWQIENSARVIAKDEVIKGDLIFTGDRLEVDGTIEGDLLVIAREVVVNGRIEGSILGVVFEKLDVNGEIGRDLRVASMAIVITGKVGRSVTVAALKTSVEKGSQINQGLLGQFSELRLAGQINGLVEFTAVQMSEISGSIQGDLHVHGIAVQWKKPAVVTGRVVDYTVRGKNPHQIKGVTVGAYETSAEPEAVELYKQMLWYSFVWYLGTLLVSLIFYRILPQTAWRFTEPTPQHFRSNFFIGILGFLGIPSLLFFLGFTVIGLPIAVLMGLAYLIMLFFAWVPVNIWFGRLIFRNRIHPVWSIVLGSLMLYSIATIPLFNLVVNLIALSSGFGMVMRNFFGNVRTQVSAGAGESPLK